VGSILQHIEHSPPEQRFHEDEVPYYLLELELGRDEEEPDQTT